MCSILLYPKYSIMDPVNTFTVPKYQTAAGTADIMSHIFELYFDGTPGKYMQDRVMEGLLKTCIHFGPVAASVSTVIIGSAFVIKLLSSTKSHGLPSW